MNAGQIYTLVLALLFALAAGLVGSFALMKRMLLASDVISHLALPGLGVAFLLKFNPIAGGAATLFLGTLLVWRLQKGTGLATDAAIGVIFAAALAIGALVTPREDLVEALFGNFQQLSLGGFLLGVAGVFLVIATVLQFKDRFTLALFSPELGAVTGLNVDSLDLIFLFIFSLTVLIGLRFMGALLSSALIILPAATARRLTDRLSQFMMVSMVASALAVGFGFLFSGIFFRTATVGPTIVIVSAFFFGCSLLFKKT
ncbi:MAG TPA: metal ABC transporter permease [Candidatus Acidoferrales bacterium]|nr:metal ABC transporter permease [Candidatus Acidoferrales bacterium]